MRLIDGDVLKRKAQKVATESWKMKIKANVETVLNQFIDWIDASPTIESERKTGKWIDGSIPTYFVCSVCAYQERYADENNFCPNCGADMRKES